MRVSQCLPMYQIFFQLGLDRVWLQVGGGGGGGGGGGERSVYVPQQQDRCLAESELIYQALVVDFNYSNPHSSWAVKVGCGRLGSQRK